MLKKIENYTKPLIIWEKIKKSNRSRKEERLISRLIFEQLQLIVDITLPYKDSNFYFIEKETLNNLAMEKGNSVVIKKIKRLFRLFDDGNYYIDKASYVIIKERYYSLITFANSISTYKTALKKR